MLGDDPMGEPAVPNDAASVFGPLLREGEKLEWTGRPHPMHAALLGKGLFGVFFDGIFGLLGVGLVGVVVYYSLRGEYAELGLKEYSWLTMAAAVFAFGGVVVRTFRYFKYAKTWYAVTTSRALVVVVGNSGERKTQGWDAAAILTPQLRDRAGLQSVYFGVSPWFENAENPQLTGFLAIKDAQAAVAALRKLSGLAHQSPTAESKSSA